MKRNHILLTCISAILLLAASSCANRVYSPAQKYAPDALREDLDLMRNIMEEYHPSLYWYTPKDSMDMLFDHYRMAIRDSMTEQEFGFSILAPITTSIRCGHTSFNYSKKYNKALRGIELPSFPLFLKIWGDTMILTRNLNRKDSVLKRGVQVHTIDGRTAADFARIMFRFMPTDGYSQNINYLRLSSAFPYYHRNIFGLQKSYAVEYSDSSGARKMTQVPLYDPRADTLTKAEREKMKAELRGKREKPSHREKMEDGRYLRIDTPKNTALMVLNTFDEGYHLHSFYRKSFKKIREQKIGNLVIDIRNNGGGNVNHYTSLAAYIRQTPFKVADSAYALRKGFGKYGKYFSTRSLNAIALGIFTTRRSDGLYHFNYWERHTFHPRNKNFFHGHVYVLISGPTFSASTLFAHTVKGQPNITLVGEEAGGGNHGNNGLMIPNITLPNTGMRVRMPLFRLIQYNHDPKDGRGVLPDVLVTPKAWAVSQGVDLKMQKVRELVANDVLAQPVPGHK